MPPTNFSPDSHQCGSSGAAEQPARTCPAQVCAASSSVAFALLNSETADRLPGIVERLDRQR
jgi:hypothetical protein